MFFLKKNLYLIFFILIQILLGCSQESNNLYLDNIDSINPQKAYLLYSNDEKNKIYDIHSKLSMSLSHTAINLNFENNTHNTFNGINYHILEINHGIYKDFAHNYESCDKSYMEANLSEMKPIKIDENKIYYLGHFIKKTNDFNPNIYLNNADFERYKEKYRSNQVFMNILSGPFLYPILSIGAGTFNPAGLKDFAMYYNHVTSAYDCPKYSNSTGTIRDYADLYEKIVNNPKQEFLIQCSKKEDIFSLDLQDRLINAQKFIQNNNISVKKHDMVNISYNKTLYDNGFLENNGSCYSSD